MSSISDDIFHTTNLLVSTISAALFAQIGQRVSLKVTIECDGPRGADMTVLHDAGATEQ